MLNTEYIIVGQGVAGSCYALKLLDAEKSFILIDHNRDKASAVAPGMYNALVLKRFSLIWNAAEQLKLMKEKFRRFEELLGDSFIEEIPTYRLLNNEDEIRTWEKKSKYKELQPYLSDSIRYDTPPGIWAPHGYAEVMQTGRVHLKPCLTTFRTWLEARGKFRQETFEYKDLKWDESGVSYRDIRAKKIVFAEGYSIKSNPFFNYLPVIGVKGEILYIKTETPVPKGIWKGYNFLLPTPDGNALTASTYEREDLSPGPSKKGEAALRKYLEDIYTGDYEILAHEAGIRPTVSDIRPLLGRHPLYKNLIVLNGMGTRGVLLAPQMSEFLYNYLEHDKPLDSEADITRFDSLFKRSEEIRIKLLASDRLNAD